MHIGIICDVVFRTKIVINSGYIFLKKVIFTAVILPNFCYTNKNIFFGLLFGKNSCWFFSRIMFAINSQRRVCLRTEEEQSAFQAKIMDRNVLAERNVVCADIMVPPLDSIYETIQTYHWGYLYTCACIFLNRLVRLFYANLEVAQDDERRMVLQSTVDGHIITVVPQSSISSSGYQYLICLPVHTMRWYFLPLWMISESSSMQFHRVKGVPLTSGLLQ